LKPENIFLARDEAGEIVPKVLDFGTATFLEEEHVGRGETITRTGQFVGTPLYTALERLRENQRFDHRVDVYSMGVILYEALTGRLPYEAQSVSELTYQLATTDPIPARTRRPELPPALERIVMQALARDPSARPSGPESFARALAAACPGSRQSAIESMPQDAPRESGAAPGRRAPWRPSLLAGSAIALIILAMWGFRKDRSRDRAGAAASAVASSFVSVPPSTPEDRREPELTAKSAEPVLGEASASPDHDPASAADRSTKASNREGVSGTRTTPPRSAAPSPNANAALTVVVVPYGTVWLDGRKIGQSPITIDVAPGPHVVAAGRDNPERESQVTLANGEPHRVVLSLSK
jgi:serine/threonine protein kinase